MAADAFYSGQGPRLAEVSLKRRMPTISIYDGNVRAGCLMSYGQDIAAFHRQAATYVDKILLASWLSHREPQDLTVRKSTRPPPPGSRVPHRGSRWVSGSLAGRERPMRAREFKAARQRLGLSQAKLAAALGMGWLQIMRYEHGRAEVPKVVALAVEALERREAEARKSA